MLKCWYICFCACCLGDWNVLQWCSYQLYSAGLPKGENDKVLDTLETKWSCHHVSRSVLSAEAICMLHAVAEFLWPSDWEAMRHCSTDSSAETWWKKRTESEPVRSRAAHYTGQSLTLSFYSVPGTSFSKAVWPFTLDTASILMLPVYLHCTTRSCWVTGPLCLGLSKYTLWCLYYDDTTQCGTSYYLTSSYVVRLLPSSKHTQISSVPTSAIVSSNSVRSENCCNDHRHRNSVMN